MLKVPSFLFLLITTLTLQAAPEIKGSPEELRQYIYPMDNIVTLYGEAEKLAYSDKARVSLVISTEERKLSDSMNANSKLKRQISDRLLAAGFNADQINSSKFSSTPEYGWFGKSPDSYRVVNRIAIDITEEAQLKEIALIADSSKSIEMSGLTFEHSEKDSFQQQVKLDALEKVMQQKASYEKSLGVKLTPVNFRETPFTLLPTPGAMRMQEALVTGLKSDKLEISSSASIRQETAPTSFDEVKYQAQVSVEFKVETHAP